MSEISIHALREEGDARPKPTRTTALKFLSTPSARRATKLLSEILPVLLISIHALREEGDVDRCPQVFYPRISIHALREEGDIIRDAEGDAAEISIHALREEGDYIGTLASLPEAEFLSTPSARRATAKTETKSLFSYKLYNILHEFRRALIYNGSKNDPNHAKRHKNPVRRCRKNAENSPFAPGRETQNNSRPSCSKGG